MLGKFPIGCRGECERVVRSMSAVEYCWGGLFN